jgi:hypothetical protein
VKSVHEMTDEELGEEFRRALQEAELGFGWRAVSRRARELLTRQDVPSVDDIRRRMYETAEGNAGAITLTVAYHCARVAHAQMLELQKPAAEARLPHYDEVALWHKKLSGETNAAIVMDILAALKHFAPATEARTKMMIEGMDREALRSIVYDVWSKNRSTNAVADEIYRLANTPADVPDRDAGAKVARDTWCEGYGNFGQSIPRWNDLSEPQRNGWRAVAAAAAKGEMT